MTPQCVYLDNHATTRTDPRVVEAMLPYFTEQYGNAGSATHPLGWAARDAVAAARKSIAAAVGAGPKEIIFTSGATESNNLAIRGVAGRYAKPGSRLISVTTEHPAVLEPLEKLEHDGLETTLLPVAQAPAADAGHLSPERVEEAICERTILVSVMLANNEIGTIQPLAQIGQICKRRGVLLHTDATQAVGRMPVDVEQLGVDLMSFSAHKIYGPKGVGALYVRRRKPWVRLRPLIDGGGQERALRSGTLNVPGIVGFARALQLCLDEMDDESQRLRALRKRLFEGLQAAVDGVELNGPDLSMPNSTQSGPRLPGNLNVSFARVDGEALLMSTPGVAASSGSACSSADPRPSHVLRALGLRDDRTRGGVRLGLGRFNTPEEIDAAVGQLAESVARLRAMSGLSLTGPEEK